MRRSFRLLVIAAALGALGAAGLAGAERTDTRTETARLRRWNVALTHQRINGDPFRLANLRLRADLRGVTRLERRIPLPSTCRRLGCEIFPTASLLDLVDLGGTEPTVVIWFWTGGAHCCSVAETVALNGGGVAARDFGNPGARVKEVGGAHLFISADDRFSYLFTSYAASADPIELWRVRTGRFVDVTRSYPGAIALDARRWWAFLGVYRRRKQEVRGLFSAWAADVCRLFPVVLVRDLTRWGYCKAI